MPLPISHRGRLTRRNLGSGSNASTATSICSMTVRSKAVASTAPSAVREAFRERVDSMSAAPIGSSGLAVRRS